MVKTAEEKVWARYRQQLNNGIQPRPLTDANRAIMEEVREEVKRACKDVQAAAHAGQEAVRRQTRKGKAEIQEFIAQGKRELEEKVDAAVEERVDVAMGKRLKSTIAAPPLEAPGETSATSSAGQEVVSAALAIPSAPPPSESGEDPDDVPPSDPEDLAEWEAEKEREREWEAGRPAREEAARARRTEEQARRAAEKLAVMQGLPAPPEEMPKWFQNNVQRWYGQTRFMEHLREEQRPLPDAAEEQLMQKRKKCRRCRENGHKSHGYSRNYCCDEHWRPEEPDAQELALIEERLRDEFAGEAAKAALEMKKVADEEAAREAAREAAARAEEAAREEDGKRAIKLLAPECLKCADCLDKNFGARHHALNTMRARDCLQFFCDKHNRECVRLQVQQQQPESRVVRASGPMRLVPFV